MAREQWTSKLGFILAAAGSAVGLGNIWRFSYVVGTEGGAAFILIYLAIVFLIGYPLLTTEIAIGRVTQRNPVGAFKKLAEGTPWWLVGALGVLTGFVILSFYSVIAGWSVAYTVKALQGFSADADFVGMFVGHITHPTIPIYWHFGFMLVNILIIGAGVVNGIQRVAKTMMPLLFILLLGLVVRGLTLPGSGAGVAFMLTPDLSEVTGQTFLRAIGQAFFTLSLGMGALITYGSYLSRKDNVADSAAWVVGLDTGIALIAGLAIFPTLFALNIPPDSGVGLAFMVLPSAFSVMPGGIVFGTMFFALLSVAALTSSISLLEVVVAWITDEKGWPRWKASFILGGLIFLLGVPAVMGYSTLSHINIAGMDILDTYDFLASDIFLPLGGLLTAIFAAHVWKTKNAVSEINDPKGKIVFGGWYGPLVGVVIPVAVGVVMIYGLYSKFFL